MYVQRIVNILKLLESKSYFLFGPRQTGKSELIKNQLGNVLTYNLLESDTYQELSASPRRLRDSITDKDRIVVIDEVQKIPALLDEVHLLIESKKIHFLLTGSSSRALKRKGVNLFSFTRNYS